MMPREKSSRRYKVVAHYPNGTKSRPMTFGRWHKAIFDWSAHYAPNILTKTVTPDMGVGDSVQTGWTFYNNLRVNFEFIRIK